MSINVQVNDDSKVSETEYAWQISMICHAYMWYWQYIQNGIKIWLST